MPSPQTLARRRLNQAMEKVFHDGDVEEAKETIRECLRATRTIRAGHDAGGHIIYEEVPDYPIRITAGVKIIEWAIGKPISRSIHAEIAAPGAPGSNPTEDILAMMLAAPAETADIVRKIRLAAIEIENAKKAQDGEIDVTPPPTKDDESTS